MEQHEQEHLYEVIKRSIEDWPKRLKKAKITQGDLAKLSGVSSQTISKIINFSEINPKINTLNDIEKALQSKGV